VAELDRARFAEILGHLIDNAAKYSPPDAPIEVRVHRSQDGSLLVDVVDRGPGIPPEQRETVFERYAAWRPAGYEETPGAGLGLFICRQHLKAHGGRIDIEDMDDRGTRVRITLPAGG
jgi:signal transduction histidine kinase